MNSSLGTYAPLVAAVSALIVIGLWGGIQVLIVLAPILGYDGRIIEPAGLGPVALIVIGAVFGSAVVANGHKEPMRRADAANARLDVLERELTGEPAREITAPPA